jgi:hypothetical protein
MFCVECKRKRASEAMKRHRKTEKYSVARARYRGSEKGRSAEARYRGGDKRTESVARYKMGDKYRATRKEWYAKNKERHNLNTNKWAKNNREKCNERQRRLTRGCPDWYVRTCWKQYGVLDVPSFLIEPMREYILLSRTIIQTKKELDRVSKNQQRW